MDKEARVNSDVKQGTESAEGFIGKEKSLEGYTKEEPVYLDPKDIIESTIGESPPS